jgi:adenosylcobinamide kinase/adenosylcobinamide-phosphate guanylyltransferase
MDSKKSSMIYFITGGERSGKSRYAQELALKLSDKPIYIATSRVWDKDFEKRVQRHKNERDERWTSIEEEKQLSKVDLKNKVAVIDCVTLWLTNFYVDTKYNVDVSLKEAKAEFEKLSQVDCTLIIISNEIGMGVHAETEVGRKFVELQGWMNQCIASKADKVILMVSGIPLTIKQ